MLETGMNRFRPNIFIVIRMKRLWLLPLFLMKRKEHHSLNDRNSHGVLRNNLMKFQLISATRYKQSYAWPIVEPRRILLGPWRRIARFGGDLLIQESELTQP